MNVITATEVLTNSFASQGLYMIAQSEYPDRDATVFHVYAHPIADDEPLARVCIANERDFPWTILVSPSNRSLSPREVFGNLASKNDVWLAADITD